jgi:Sulfatase
VLLRAFPLSRYTRWAAALTLALSAWSQIGWSQQQQTKKPNILVIFGDDIGQSDLSVYTMGLMGFRTPNIDRVVKEGMIFTDYYAEQSCTAGRSTFKFSISLRG